MAAWIESNTNDPLLGYLLEIKRNNNNVDKIQPVLRPLLPRFLSTAASPLTESATPPILIALSAFTCRYGGPLMEFKLIGTFRHLHGWTVIMLTISALEQNAKVLLKPSVLTTKARESGAGTRGIRRINLEEEEKVR